MLTNSLSIWASNGHGLAAHGECRRRTSARCSSRGVLVFCTGGNKFNPTFTTNEGVVKVIRYLKCEKRKIRRKKGLTWQGRKKLKPRGKSIICFTLPQRRLHSTREVYFVAL